MANSKKYNTYIIGFPEDINNCPRIIVCRSSDFAGKFGDISLFYVSSIAESIITGETPGLIIPRSEKGCFEYDKDNLFWILGTDDEGTYENRKEWGFDIIIYLSSRDDALGYTKFLDLCGKGTINLNIYLEFSTELGEINQDIILDISLSSVSDILLTWGLQILHS